MITKTKKVMAVVLMFAFVFAFMFLFATTTYSVNAATKKPEIKSMHMVRAFKFKPDHKNHTAWPINKPTVRLSWASVPKADSYDITFARDNGTGGSIGCYTDGETTCDYTFTQDMVAPLKITVKAVNNKGKTISKDTEYVSMKDLLKTKDGKAVALHSKSQSNIKSSGNAEKMPITTLTKDSSGAVLLYQCKCTKKSMQNWKFFPGSYGESYGSGGFEIKWFPVNTSIKMNLYEGGKYRYSQSITTTWKGTINARAVTKSDKPIKGVKFTVYKANKKSKVKTMTTDKNGKCHVSVYPGEYYVKVTDVPKGHKNTKEGKDVTVQNKKTSTVKFEL